MIGEDGEHARVEGAGRLELVCGGQRPDDGVLHEIVGAFAIAGEESREGPQMRHAGDQIGVFDIAGLRRFDIHLRHLIVVKEKGGSQHRETQLGSPCRSTWTRNPISSAVNGSSMMPSYSCSTCCWSHRFRTGSNESTTGSPTPARHCAT